MLNGHRPFHWPLEFPEVLIEPARHGEAPGFSAIVGNPPFMGGKKITGSLGTSYRDYLLEVVGKGVRGNADLAAYFLLRAGQLVQVMGGMGLLMTNTIAQGETREVGLDRLNTEGFTITRAVSSRPWPGIASLEIAHLWIRKTEWAGEFVLDEKPAPGITPFLTSPGRVSGTPHQLARNARSAFIGSYVLGTGFVLDDPTAQSIIAKDDRYRDVLFMYINGEDLYSRSDRSPSRWIINFHDWPIEKAMTYPDVFRIVQERVKPERDKLGLKQDPSAKGYARLWWQFGRRGAALYETVAQMDRVLVRAQVSSTWAWDFVPNEYVYDAKLIVTLDSMPLFSPLQSSLHWAWSLQYGTTLRQDLSYTPTSNFETFPFPSMEPDEQIGQAYLDHRSSIMATHQIGLTKTYNRLHDQNSNSQAVVRLRALQVSLDCAVATAYGWDDLDLGHGFHETKQGSRFTISDAARREALDRLLELNHERYADEVAKGLHDKVVRKRAANRRLQAHQPSLIIH